MNTSEILEAAKEAGLYNNELDLPEVMQNFAAIIEKRTIERCSVVAEQLATLTSQRDLAVEAMQMAVEMIATNAHERRHVRWKLQDAISTIKESEVK